MNDFAEAATQLAGLSGMLLGWRPDDFWSATPAELAAILSAFSEGDDGGVPAARDDVTRLMEQFPDGR
ncbi:MAG: phage tail assembly chaperone [Parasphingopyxis sp.]|uniref:phage tail assembly chaperone n=1 Tax=Parasphingopyxis sp. TaxID=1920299 RepID=UPI003FA03B75